MSSFTCLTCANIIKNCNSISCDNCDSWHHLQCTNIDIQKKLFVRDKKKKWICPKYTYCSYCNLVLKRVSNSINCNGCNVWVHLKCSGLTKKKIQCTC